MLNDIDVAFYVKSEKTPSSEPDLLNWLAERLREAYPQMKPDQIKPNRHSVCIKYAVSGLSVDVVPVQYKGDPDDRGYLFAFDGGKPVLTSIPLHLAFIRKRKARQKDDFAQVIRLVKWWVRLQKGKDEDFRLQVLHHGDDRFASCGLRRQHGRLHHRAGEDLHLHRQVQAQEPDLLHGLLPGVEATGSYREANRDF